MLVWGVPGALRLEVKAFAGPLRMSASFFRSRLTSAIEDSIGSATGDDYSVERGAQGREKAPMTIIPIDPQPAAVWVPR